MPTEENLNSMSKWCNREFIKKVKKYGHFKIKWENISGIELKDI